MNAHIWRLTQCVTLRTLAHTHTHMHLGRTRTPRVSRQQGSSRSSWLERRCRTKGIARGEGKEGVPVCMSHCTVCLHVGLLGEKGKEGVPVRHIVLCGKEGVPVCHIVLCACMCISMS